LAESANNTKNDRKFWASMYLRIRLIRSIIFQLCLSMHKIGFAAAGLILSSRSPKYPRRDHLTAV
jgi:hypothetical protein